MCWLLHLSSANHDAQKTTKFTAFNRPAYCAAQFAGPFTANERPSGQAMISSLLPLPSTQTHAKTEVRYTIFWLFFLPKDGAP